MTKTDLINVLREKSKLSQNEATEIIEIVLSEMKETLIKGENIKLPGFGNFQVKNKDARKGRNPRTGETIDIPARKVVSFKISSTLKQRLNEGE